MSFAAPGMLWWLLAAGPVVAFFLAHPKPRRVTTTTLRFWTDGAVPAAPRPRAGRLRDAAELAAYFAVLAGAAVALAAPFPAGGGGRRFVLVIDNSANTAAPADPAEPGGGTRLEVAKRRAAGVLGALGETDAAAILTTAPPRRASDLGIIKQSTGAGDAAGALDLAGVLYGGDARVLYFSARPPDRPGAAERVACGAPAGNVALTAARARRALAGGATVFLKVANFNDVPARVRVDADLGGVPRDAVPLELAAGEVRAISLQFNDAAGGELTVRLHLQDADGAENALAADDAAAVELPARRSVPVTLITPGGRAGAAVAAALRANPAVRLSVREDMPAAAPAGGVLVLHRRVPGAIPKGPVVILDPAGDTEIFTLSNSEEANDVRLTAAGRTSPLLADVGETALNGPARPPVFAPDVFAEPLAETADGRPVLAHVRRIGGDVLVLAADLERGELTARPAFPVLLANAVAELSGAAGELGAPADLPGRAASGTRRAGGSSQNIGLPAGRPWRVWLLLAAAAGVAGLTVLRVPKSVTAAAVRAGAVLLFAAAAWGPAWRGASAEPFTALAVDESASVGNAGRAAARAFLAEADPDGGDFAVLPFAAEPGAAGAGIENYGTGGETDGTDLAAAVRAAAALVPPGRFGRAVLFTDGRATAGDAVAAARAAAAAGVRVDVVPVPAAGVSGAAVARLMAPATVARGEPFAVVADLVADRPAAGAVDLFRGPARVGSRRVELNPGGTTVRFPQTLIADGSADYTARLRVDGGGTIARPPAAAVVAVAGERRVLLLTADPTAARPLRAALETQNISVDVRPPSDAPAGAAGYEPFAAVVLADAPAGDFAAPQLGALAGFVRDLGGGLVAVGGPAAFGPGGWEGTPVGELFPVRSDYEDERETPSLALVLVVDKSGSMAGEKLAMAQSAAVAAAEVLRPTDRIGVLAFDAAPRWAADLAPAADPAGLSRSLRELSAGGGTDLAPALREAARALSTSAAALKRAVLLTDGAGGAGPAETAAELFPAAGATLSAVALGPGADATLLARLAELGGGRNYVAATPAAVPQLVLREATVKGRNAVREEPFFATRARNAAVLDGLDFAAAPFLLGRSAVELKPGAELLLTADAGEPLLARRRAGAGNVVAWAGDAGSRWAADWLDWPDYPKFWAQLLRDVMRPDDAGGLTVTSDRDGGEVRVVADVYSPGDETRPAGWRDGADVRVIAAYGNGVREDYPARQTAPGRYEAILPAPTAGPARLVVELRTGGRVLARRALGVAPAVDQERLPRPTDRAFLARLAAAGGGGIEPDPGVRVRPGRPRRPRRPPAVAVAGGRGDSVLGRRRGVATANLIASHSPKRQRGTRRAAAHRRGVAGASRPVPR